MGIFDVVLAELYAIHKACYLISSKLQLADLKISVISDSKTAVIWVNGDGFGNFNLVNLIYDVRACLHRFPGVSIIYRGRGANGLAGSLAKLGSSRAGDRLEWGDL